MFYKYAVTFHFRNGKIKEILATQCSTYKDPGGFSLILSLNNDIVAELPEGIGSAFSVDEVNHYNAFPRKALYDYFPVDWDPKTENFSLIDKISINSMGREAGPQTKHARSNTPGSSC